MRDKRIRFRDIRDKELEPLNSWVAFDRLLDKKYGVIDIWGVDYPLGEVLEKLNDGRYEALHTIFIDTKLKSGKWFRLYGDFYSREQLKAHFGLKPNERAVEQE